MKVDSVSLLDIYGACRRLHKKQRKELEGLRESIRANFDFDDIKMWVNMEDKQIWVFFLRKSIVRQDDLHHAVICSISVDGKVKIFYDSFLKRHFFRKPTISKYNIKQLIDIAKKYKESLMYGMVIYKENEEYSKLEVYNERDLLRIAYYSRVTTSFFLDIPYYYEKEKQNVEYVEVGKPENSITLQSFIDVAELLKTNITICELPEVIRKEIQSE